MESLRIQKDTEIAELVGQLEKNRDEYEKRINELQNNLQDFQRITVKLDAEKLELNARLAVFQDIEVQLRTWKEHHDDMEAQKAELQKQLDGASQYMVSLEEKFYQSQEEHLGMLKQLKAYEAEVEKLRQYIIDLKSRIAVYIPVKGDLIDRKLAEYINNYPDRQKLKIMFMRESEGVYQFGTKRVFVKCVKDKIEIKVGGGFLNLDEFIDQYTPEELQKLERKDHSKRISDRIALQKTLNRADNSPNPSPLRGGGRKKQKV